MKSESGLLIRRSLVRAQVEEPDFASLPSLDGGLFSFPFEFCIGSAHQVILMVTCMRSANHLELHNDPS